MFKEIFQKRRLLTEKQLAVELDRLKKNPQSEKLLSAMEYSLTAGGKRLRPVLLMAAADTVGANGEDFAKTACALEMIHTYSLIHDDLPAMDNDDYRRGKPTNHKIYGDGMAILAGDALLTFAFDTIANENAAPETIIKVLREVSDAAGANGMVGGQATDLESEGKNLNLESLKKMHLGKTGALFRAAILSGAMLGSASDRELNALKNYAENFGLAFQITDDILDVVGNETEIGKPIGSDARNNKSTYVALLSLEKARQFADEAVKNALLALEIFDERADFLRDLAKYLTDRKT